MSESREQVERELAEQIIDALPGLGDTTWLAERVARIRPLLARALAACALEARMNVHANALHDYYASHGTLDLEKYHRAELERAVEGE